MPRAPPRERTRAPTPAAPPRSARRPPPPTGAPGQAARDGARPRPRCSPSRHRTHELQAVALAQVDIVVALALERLAVSFDDDEPRVQGPRPDEVGDGRTGIDVVGRAVRKDAHGVAIDG